jgi:serine/threonine protein phosphatase PrpC
MESDGEVIFAEPKVHKDFERVRQSFVMPNHQMRRSLGDFSKDLAFEMALSSEHPSHKKQPNSTMGLSFSFVSLDAPSGQINMTSGTSSSDDLRISVMPNANSFQNFQDLLQQGHSASPTPLRKPLTKELNFGVFGTQENAAEHFYNAALPHKSAICEHQTDNFMEEPKWKENDSMDLDKKHDCDCDHDREEPNHGFFAIYDAHGGRGCADYVHENLHHNVASHPLFKLDPERALLEGILKTERDYIDVAVQENREGTMGTSVCAALIFGNQLLLANVGDSCAILCRNNQHIRLAYPHTLQNISEKSRVESLGISTRDSKLLHPTWNNTVFNTHLTRSLGDVYFKHDKFLNGKLSGVIPDPEIAKIAITADDQFLFLGSSSYWEVVSPKETIEFLNSMGNLSPNEGCKQLTNLALKRAGDTNITTLLVNLSSK